MRNKISCLINTYNAAEYLDEAMKAADFVDEFVIVDMGSTDQTLEIAARYNAVVFDHPNVGFADPARAFGVARTSHEWVIILDADEIVTPGFKKFVLEQLENPKFDVYYMYFRNFFFGRELKGSSWSYKDFRKPLFFKKGFVELRPIVHDFFRVLPEAKVFATPVFDNALIHFNYSDVSSFVSKLDRYTNFEKSKWPCQFKVFEMVYQFVRELGGRFVIKQGYKDGWVGLYLGIAMGFYRATVVAKNNTPDRQTIQENYKKLARQLIKNG